MRAPWFRCTGAASMNWPWQLRLATRCVMTFGCLRSAPTTAAMSRSTASRPSQSYESAG